MRTPVFGGMILASFIGIFAIPPIYVTAILPREIGERHVLVAE